MKMQIKEFAEFTGVSVRTLHYYDEIGLLPPAFIDKSTGYRFYDENKALQEQKYLLILKKERLERLISAIDNAAKGENVMRAFDNSEFEKHKTEAKEKWGYTDAYKEHEEKTKNYSKDTWNNLSEEMNDIFAEFAVCMKSCEKVTGAYHRELLSLHQ